MAMAAMNRKGVFGGKLSFTTMSAGVHLCILQENPQDHLTVVRIKVRGKMQICKSESMKIGLPAFTDCQQV
jgi:hypothetical protein